MKFKFVELKMNKVPVIIECMDSIPYALFSLLKNLMLRVSYEWYLKNSQEDS